SIATVVDYARRVVDEARAVRDRSGTHRAVRLPGLRVDALSFDPGMSDAVGRYFVPTRYTDAGAPLPMRTFIVHPGVEGISAPLPWDARRPAHPQRVCEALGEAGLQAAYFHDLAHWHIYD